MLDSTAKLNDIITELQSLEGINQKADLKSALVAKGVSASDTDSMADLVSKVNSSLYGSNIKSIQRGSVASDSITSSGLSISISSVDLTKSVVMVHFCSRSTDQNDLVRAEITSPTEIKLYIGNSTGYAYRVIYWEVIEFNNVKTLQKGTTVTTSMDDVDQNISISSVNVSKSMVFSSYSSTNSSPVYVPMKSVILINSTTLKIIKYDYNGLSTHHWQVIEFN